LNSANANISVIFGVQTTQNNWISANQAYSQASYAQANAANNLAQSAYNTANAAQASVAVIQGVDITQNTQIQGIQGVDLIQNTAISIIQGVDLSQNTAISIIQGVDLGQNTAISIIQGVDLTQNTQIQGIQGVDLTQNNTLTYLQAGLNTANANTAYLQGALNTANASIVYLQSGLNTANANSFYIQSGLNSANANISILFGIANSQNANIVAVQALANTDYTTLTAPAGTYGNTNYVPIITLTANGRVANITTTSISGSGSSGGVFNYFQNTAPSSANSHDFWTNSDTGVEYENFGTPSSPVWAEIGPTGIAVNTAPGIISSTQLYVNYTPATTVNAAIQITAANTKGGTGYADAFQITNTSAGVTNQNKYIRLDSTGNLQVVNSTYQITSMSLSDAGDLTLAGNSTTNGIAAGYAPNRPAFRVSGNGGSISATTTVAGGYLLVDYNQGSYLNTSTGYFTAPVAGLYQVDVVVRTNSNTNPSINQIIIRKTTAIGSITTSVIMVEFGVNTTMNHTGGATIVKLAAGDTLRFDVTSGTITFDGNDNWSVAYIG